MDILGARRSIEQKLLMQSVALMALVAVSGTVMGIVTGSSAVLLDGVFSFVDVVIKIVSSIRNSKEYSIENSWPEVYVTSTRQKICNPTR